MKSESDKHVECGGSCSECEQYLRYAMRDEQNIQQYMYVQGQTVVRTLVLYALLTSSAACMHDRGVATGGVYRYIYPPPLKNQSTLQIFMWSLVVFFSLTQDRTNCCWFWNWND